MENSDGKKKKKEKGMRLFSLLFLSWPQRPKLDHAKFLVNVSTTRYEINTCALVSPLLLPPLLSHPYPRCTPYPPSALLYPHHRAPAPRNNPPIVKLVIEHFVSLFCGIYLPRRVFNCWHTVVKAILSTGNRVNCHRFFRPAWILRTKDAFISFHLF